jgi:predicted SAM-dependent methyltransferase
MGLFKRARDAHHADGRPQRLHIGCGQQSIPGWINIDNQGLPGVDQVLDVRHGLPFRDVAAIYAEHFLEHLSLDDGLDFLRECRRVLADDGTLRLSTPSLEWVLTTHYRWHEAAPENRLSDCVRLNRAFHAWGHQFLYNAPTLAAALRAAGFARAEFHAYGESGIPELTGLERHEKSDDTPELPHVLIVEGSGRAAPVPMPEEPLRELREGLEAR